MPRRPAAHQLLDEIEAAHREHKFLASDILIKEKLLRTRNDALEVLQLGRQVCGAACLRMLSLHWLVELFSHNPNLSFTPRRWR